MSDVLKRYEIEVVANLKKLDSELNKLEKDLSKQMQNAGLAEGFRGDIERMSEGIKDLKNEVRRSIAEINNSLKIDSNASDFIQKFEGLSSSVDELSGKMAELKNKSGDALKISGLKEMRTEMTESFAAISQQIDNALDKIKVFQGFIDDFRGGKIQMPVLFDEAVVRSETDTLSKLVQRYKELRDTTDKITGYSLSDLIESDRPDGITWNDYESVIVMMKNMLDLADDLKSKGVNISEILTSDVNLSNIKQQVGDLKKVQRDFVAEVDSVRKDVVVKAGQKPDIYLRWKSEIDPNETADKILGQIDGLVEEVQEKMKPVKIKTELDPKDLKDTVSHAVKNLNKGIIDDVKDIELPKIEIDIVGKVDKDKIKESLQEFKDEFDYQRYHDNENKNGVERYILGSDGDIATESTLSKILGVISGWNGGVGVSGTGGVDGVQGGEEYAANPTVAKEMEEFNKLFSIRRRGKNVSSEAIRIASNNEKFYANVLKEQEKDDMLKAIGGKRLIDAKFEALIKSKYFEAENENVKGVAKYSVEENKPIEAWRREILENILTASALSDLKNRFGDKWDTVSANELIEAIQKNYEQIDAEKFSKFINDSRKGKQGTQSRIKMYESFLLGNGVQLKREKGRITGQVYDERHTVLNANQVIEKTQNSVDDVIKDAATDYQLQKEKTDLLISQKGILEEILSLNRRIESGSSSNINRDKARIDELSKSLGYMGEVSEKQADLDAMISERSGLIAKRTAGTISDPEKSRLTELESEIPKQNEAIRQEYIRFAGSRMSPTENGKLLIDQMIEASKAEQRRIVGWARQSAGDIIDKNVIRISSDFGYKRAYEETQRLKAENAKMNWLVKKKNVNGVYEDDYSAMTHTESTQYVKNLRRIKHLQDSMKAYELTHDTEGLIGKENKKKNTWNAEGVSSKNKKIIGKFLLSNGKNDEERLASLNDEDLIVLREVLGSARDEINKSVAKSKKEMIEAAKKRVDESIKDIKGIFNAASRKNAPKKVTEEISRDLKLLSPDATSAQDEYNAISDERKAILNKIKEQYGITDNSSMHRFIELLSVGDELRVLQADLSSVSKILDTSKIDDNKIRYNLRRGKQGEQNAEYRRVSELKKKKRQQREDSRVAFFRSEEEFKEAEERHREAKEHIRTLELTDSQLKAVEEGRLVDLPKNIGNKKRTAISQYNKTLNEYAGAKQNRRKTYYEYKRQWRGYDENDFWNYDTVSDNSLTTEEYDYYIRQQKDLNRMIGDARSNREKLLRELHNDVSISSLLKDVGFLLPSDERQSREDAIKIAEETRKKQIGEIQAALDRANEELRFAETDFDSRKKAVTSEQNARIQKAKKKRDDAIFDNQFIIDAYEDADDKSYSYEDVVVARKAIPEIQESYANEMAGILGKEYFAAQKRVDIAKSNVKKMTARLEYVKRPIGDVVMPSSPVNDDLLDLLEITEKQDSQYELLSRMADQGVGNLYEERMKIALAKERNRGKDELLTIDRILRLADAEQERRDIASRQAKTARERAMLADSASVKTKESIESEFADKIQQAQINMNAAKTNMDALDATRRDLEKQIKEADDSLVYQKYVENEDKIAQILKGRETRRQRIESIQTKIDTAKNYIESIKKGSVKLTTSKGGTADTNKAIATATANLTRLEQELATLTDNDKTVTSAEDKEIRVVQKAQKDMLKKAKPQLNKNMFGIGSRTNLIKSLLENVKVGESAYLDVKKQYDESVQSTGKTSSESQKLLKSLRWRESSYLDSVLEYLVYGGKQEDILPEILKYIQESKMNPFKKVLGETNYTNALSEYKQTLNSFGEGSAEVQAALEQMKKNRDEYIDNVFTFLANGGDSKNLIPNLLELIRSRRNDEVRPILDLIAQNDVDRARAAQQYNSAESAFNGLTAQRDKAISDLQNDDSDARLWSIFNTLTKKKTNAKVDEDLIKVGTPFRYNSKNNIFKGMNDDQKYASFLVDYQLDRVNKARTELGNMEREANPEEYDKISKRYEEGLAKLAKYREEAVRLNLKLSEDTGRMYLDDSKKSTALYKDMFNGIVDRKIPKYDIGIDTEAAKATTNALLGVSDLTYSIVGDIETGEKRELFENMDDDQKKLAQEYIRERQKLGRLKKGNASDKEIEAQELVVEDVKARNLGIGNLFNEKGFVYRAPSGDSANNGVGGSAATSPGANPFGLATEGTLQGIHGILSGIHASLTGGIPVSLQAGESNATTPIPSDNAKDSEKKGNYFAGMSPEQEAEAQKLSEALDRYRELKRNNAPAKEVEAQDKLVKDLQKSNINLGNKIGKKGYAYNPDRYYYANMEGDQITLAKELSDAIQEKYRLKKDKADQKLITEQDSKIAELQAQNIAAGNLIKKNGYAYRPNSAPSASTPLASGVTTGLPLIAAQINTSGIEAKLDGIQNTLNGILRVSVDGELPPVKIADGDSVQSGNVIPNSDSAPASKSEPVASSVAPTDEDADIDYQKLIDERKAELQRTIEDRKRKLEDIENKESIAYSQGDFDKGDKFAEMGAILGEEIDVLEKALHEETDEKLVELKKKLKDKKATKPQPTQSEPAPTDGVDVNTSTPSNLPVPYNPNNNPNNPPQNPSHNPPKNPNPSPNPNPNPKPKPSPKPPKPPIAPTIYDEIVNAIQKRGKSSRDIDSIKQSDRRTKNGDQTRYNVRYTNGDMDVFNGNMDRVGGTTSLSELNKKYKEMHSILNQIYNLRKKMETGTYDGTDDDAKAELRRLRAQRREKEKEIAADKKQLKIKGNSNADNSVTRHRNQTDNAIESLKKYAKLNSLVDQYEAVSKKIVNNEGDANENAKERLRILKKIQKVSDSIEKRGLSKNKEDEKINNRINKIDANFNTKMISQLEKAVDKLNKLKTDNDFSMGVLDSKIAEQTDEVNRLSEALLNAKKHMDTLFRTGKISDTEYNEFHDGLKNVAAKMDSDYYKSTADYRTKELSSDESLKRLLKLRGSFAGISMPESVSHVYDEERAKITQFTDDYKNGVLSLEEYTDKYADSIYRLKKVSKIGTGQFVDSGISDESSAMSTMLGYADSQGKTVKDIRKISDDGDISTFTMQVRNASGMVEELKFKYSSMAETVVVETKQMGTQLSGLSGLFKELQSKFKQVAMYWTATFIDPYDIINYGRQVLSMIVQLDDAIVDLKKTSTMSSHELDQFYFNANNNAKDLGVTTQEFIQQAADMSRSGYSSSEEATNMARYSSQFAAISPDIDTSEATTGLISIMKAFDIDSSQVLDGIISKVNVLGNTFSETNGDILEGLTRSSASMSAANNSLDETMALFTAGQEVVQNAETVGNL